ncbi:alpha/beta hydrolase [Cognatiluteimonas telluris]|jgi:alpha/beta superfamily hydrolase|uniref:alpha/beta hydrolase n=1 Tax=Cognatiluteimonas telluris TaxID=1104775 RepID=UPI001408BB09|nr:alpha/beta fold hydrolase [Lysobacter telluris]
MPAPSFPTEPASVLLDGPAGALELAVDPAEGPPVPAVAVFCHPLPTEGGTMHNKVVTMATRALREVGVDTVRFNFRGVGASQGHFDDGNGETEDLVAVASWVRAQRPAAALWLGGFSFGAYVALRAAPTLQPAFMLSIAPPVRRSWDFDALLLPTCPWLVIQGEADEIVDPQAVYAWIEAMATPPQLVRMPDTSHFFHRRLMDLRGAVKNGVRPWLPSAA